METAIHSSLGFARDDDDSQVVFIGVFKTGLIRPAVCQVSDKFSLSSAR